VQFGAPLHRPPVTPRAARDRVDVSRHAARRAHIAFRSRSAARPCRFGLNPPPPFHPKSGNFSLLFAISPINHSLAFDERWRARQGEPPANSVPSYGLMLMRLQVFIIYYQTAWLKCGDTYWRTGDLMAYFARNWMEH
jgi:hypothetical protein